VLVAITFRVFQSKSVNEAFAVCECERHDPGAPQARGHEHLGNEARLVTQTRWVLDAPVVEADSEPKSGPGSTRNQRAAPGEDRGLAM
jgi:hypothetical protein